MAVLVLVVAWRSCTGDGDDPPAPGPEVQLPLQAGATGTIPSAPGAAAGFVVTIGEVVDGFVHPSNQFEIPAAGNRWWAITVSVANTGDRPATALTYRLRLSGGSESEPRFVPGVPGMLPYAYDDLAPGDDLSGLVIFEIPADGAVTGFRASGPGNALLFVTPP